ncbi:DNA cytosine methyltransferase [Sphingobium sp. LMA1-1-1.1]|uniref:DNA cytosine methyltransferase n=1 Tax=Sphingobium sp. LMA1-1-1.1 TaxID=3135238 RepID=UPI0034381ABC
MKTVSLLDDARAPLERDWSVGINVDNFAGGGGASTGLEQAGFPVHVAINHDPEAVAMHAANHPAARHHCQSVWSIDPLEAVTFADGDGLVRAHAVRVAWFSPDCKHFSKAKGGKPVEKNIRDLAWVVHHWIDRLGPALRPAIIMLENVEEFRTWGPLGDDGRPCPTRKGKTFNQWVAKLRRAGYRVQWKELRACDYGAPTSRKRLFLKARCDGRRISWPKPTHGKPGSPAVISGRLLPWRTAAEIIDWSIPCPSIFERARPLKDATCRRIAAGIMRYVINAPHPFIVPVCNSSWASGRAYAGDEPLRTITTAKGGEFAVVAPYFAPLTHHGSAERVYGPEDPLPTVTGAHRGEIAVIAPHLMTMRNSGKPYTAGDEPNHTITAGGAHQYLVAAFMAQHNSMPRGGLHAGHDARSPVSTITGRGTQQQLVASHIVKLRGTSKDGQATDTPLHTISAGGLHHAEVRAFLVKYYGAAQHGQEMTEPLHAVTAKARFGLVTVTIAGEEYAIVDIGMRMLSPRELFLAQGFPADYIIDLEVNGRPLTKTAQVRMCGNSVSPVMARALASVDFVNDDDAAERIAA